MTPLRQQMVAALELNGKSPATVEAYVREVALLSKFYRKRPDLISEAELVHYLLHRKNTDRLAPTSMRICYSGLRFFFQRVLDREWKIFALLHARRELRRPCVLSRAEVHRILQAAYPFHNQVYFTTLYSCGLRLHEGLHLEVGDVDSPRLMLHVHRGKGARDRVLPLPEKTLLLLRQYWKTHRHPRLLFPATGQIHRLRSHEPCQCPRRFPQGSPPRRHLQTRHQPPLPPPLLCHSSAGSPCGVAHHPTLPRPLQPRNHHRLSPSHSSRPATGRRPNQPPAGGPPCQP